MLFVWVRRRSANTGKLLRSWRCQYIGLDSWLANEVDAIAKLEYILAKNDWPYDWVSPD